MLNLLLPGLVMLLNTFDAVSTVAATQYFGAIEVNPLMSYLLEVDPWVFLIFKIVFVNGMAAFAWQAIRPVHAFLLVAALYVVLAGTHLYLWAHWLT